MRLMDYVRSSMKDYARNFRGASGARGAGAEIEISGA
jgi:hypothetical protein